MNDRGLSGPSAEAERSAARRGSLALRRHLRSRLRAMPEAGMPGMGLMPAPSPRPAPDPDNRPDRPGGDHSERSRLWGTVRGLPEICSSSTGLRAAATAAGEADWPVAALRRTGGGGIRSDRRSIRARVLPITGGAVLSRPGRALVGDLASSRHSSSGFRIDRTRTHLRSHRGPIALRAGKRPALPLRRATAYPDRSVMARYTAYTAMTPQSGTIARCHRIRSLVALLAVARQGHLIFSRLGRRLPADPDVEHARQTK